MSLNRSTVRTKPGAHHAEFLHQSFKTGGISPSDSEYAATFLCFPTRIGMSQLSLIYGFSIEFAVFSPEFYTVGICMCGERSRR